MRGSGRPWDTAQTYSYIDRGLAEGTSAQYTVRAVDGHNTAWELSPAATATVGRTDTLSDPWWGTDQTNDSWSGWNWGGW